MNKKTDKGIILSRSDFAERDRILTVLLQAGGKVRMIAKGVRSAKSKMAGGIELLSETNLGYIQGRGDMLTLTSSRLIRHFGKIVQDYDKTTMAYEVLKGINKVTDEGYGQEYYPLVLSCLAYLDNESINCDNVAIWFNVNLLNLMGSSVNLQTDSNGKKLQESARYSFDYDKNCFYPDESGVFSKQAIKFLRVTNEADKPIQARIPAPETRKLNQLLTQLVKEAIR